MICKRAALRERFTAGWAFVVFLASVDAHVSWEMVDLFEQFAADTGKVKIRIWIKNTGGLEGVLPALLVYWRLLLYEGVPGRLLTISGAHVPFGDS